MYFDVDSVAMKAFLGDADAVQFDLYLSIDIDWFQSNSPYIRTDNGKLNYYQDYLAHTTTKGTVNGAECYVHNVTFPASVITKQADDQAFLLRYFQKAGLASNYVYIGNVKAVYNADGTLTVTITPEVYKNFYAADGSKTAGRALTQATPGSPFLFGVRMTVKDEFDEAVAIGSCIYVDNFTVNFAE